MKVEIVKQYSIFMINKPGSLAKFARLFAEKGVNIIGITSEVRDDSGLVRIALEAKEDTSGILTQAGFASVESKLLSIEMENKPGQLHRVTQILADAGINITTVYGTAFGEGTPTHILLAVDDSKKAVETLRHANYPPPLENF